MTELQAWTKKKSMAKIQLEIILKLHSVKHRLCAAVRRKENRDHNNYY